VKRRPEVDPGERGLEARPGFQAQAGDRGRCRRAPGRRLEVEVEAAGAGAARDPDLAGQPLQRQAGQAQHRLADLEAGGGAAVGIGRQPHLAAEGTGDAGRDHRDGTVERAGRGLHQGAAQGGVPVAARGDQRHPGLAELDMGDAQTARGAQRLLGAGQRLGRLPRAALDGQPFEQHGIEVARQGGQRRRRTTTRSALTVARRSPSILVSKGPTWRTSGAAGKPRLARRAAATRSTIQGGQPRQHRDRQHDAGDRPARARARPVSPTGRLSSGDT
jgi:hypothetical protein